MIVLFKIVEADVASHQDRIEAITSAATQFVERGHFDSDNIAHKQKVLTDRYAALQTPMAIRKQRLLDSLQVNTLIDLVAVVFNVGLGSTTFPRH